MKAEMSTKGKPEDVRDEDGDIKKENILANALPLTSSGLDQEDVELMVISLHIIRVVSITCHQRDSI